MRKMAHRKARRFYNRSGSKQDARGFSEDKVVDLLIAHRELRLSQADLEFGCGAGAEIIFPASGPRHDISF